MKANVICGTLFGDENGLETRTSFPRCPLDISLIQSRDNPRTGLTERRSDLLEHVCVKERKSGCGIEGTGLAEPKRRQEPAVATARIARDKDPEIILPTLDVPHGTCVSPLKEIVPFRGRTVASVRSPISYL